MRNFFKTFGIIAMVAVIGFGVVACDDSDDGDSGKTKTLSGTLTAADGGMMFLGVGVFIDVIAASGSNSWILVDFTTNLPAPDDSFTLSNYFGSGQPPRTREITGLTEGQQINWTATSEYYIKRVDTNSNTLRIQLD